MPPTAMAAAGLQQAQNLVGEIMGIGLQPIKNKQQVKQQARLNQVNEASMKEMGKFNYEQQMKMWEATNYSAQMEQLKKAGLNPGLMYGQSGGGGATVSAQAGQNTGGGAGVAQASRGNEGMGMMMGQMALLEAQRKNIEADTELKRADATKTAGVDTELGKTQIQNLTQGIENQKVIQKLNEVQDSILRNELWESYESQDDRMQIFAYQAQKEIGQAKSAMAQGNIDEATIQTKIKILQTQAVGELLKNALTKAQTDKTKSDIQVNNAEINKMAADIIQNWTRLGMEERKTAIYERVGKFNSALSQRTYDNILKGIGTITRGGIQIGDNQKNILLPPPGN